jgi:glycosyltransferase involved in cell wall biosynthesis
MFLSIVSYFIAINEGLIMKVSVIIPFRSKNEKLMKCIASVRRQNYKDIEIIVSSDIETISEPGVKSVTDPKCKGPGFKRNLGASASRGDILFFLDSDCVMKRNTVGNLIKTFEKTKADAISGKALGPQKSNFLGYIVGLEYENRFERMGEGYVDVAATTCLAVNKDVFNKLRGFREYSVGEAIGEDWDFSFRLYKAGFKIYHTNGVEVFHEHGNDTLKRYLMRQYQHAAYRVVHFRRFGKITDSYSNKGFFISSMLFFDIPAAIRLYDRTGDIKVFICLPLISFLRTMAWICGMFSGMIK